MATNIGKRCSVKCCTNTKNFRNLSFFGYPKEVERRAIWMKNCHTEHLAYSLSKSNISYKVCEEHFEDRMFLNSTTKCRLVFNAVPTLFSFDIEKEPVTNVSISSSHISCASLDSSSSFSVVSVENDACTLTVDSSNQTPSYTNTPWKKNISSTNDEPCYSMENYNCKRSNYIRCCLTGCDSARNDVVRRTFFAFPKDPTRCTAWLENCGLDNLKTFDPVILNKKYRICSLHFKDSMFSNYQKNRLFPNATPTLCKKQIIESNLVQIKDDISHNPYIISSKSPKTCPVISHIENDHCYILINNKNKPQLNNHCYNFINDKNGTQKNVIHSLLKNNLLNKALPPSKNTQVHQIKPFQEIINNVDLLRIPSKWHHDFSCANTKMVVAFHKLGSYKENYMRLVEKQLILTEEFHLLLYIYDKQIEISDIGYPLDMQVKTCKDLENIIVKFDRV